MTAVTRFRKKPVEVEAVQWTGENFEEIRVFVGNVDVHGIGEVPGFDWGGNPGSGTGLVFDYLHESWVSVYPGQWVIKGTRSEFYPIAPEALADSYEQVECSPKAAR